MASVFLSPSTQYYNPYYGNEGDEREYMNLVADDMEPYLTASGIQYGRNDPNGSVSRSIARSNEGNYDLHLALHSNASGENNPGGQRGIDVYYYTGSAQGKRAAEIIAENLKTVYPLPDKVRALPNSTFAELRLTRAPAVLAEIGYHDNQADASWIRNNVPRIAEALSRAVAQYLGVAFKAPSGKGNGTGSGSGNSGAGDGGGGTTATVKTGGGRLNIRSGPSLEAEVIAQAPNGATLTVVAREGEWYLIRRGNVEGYVDSQYLVIN